MLGFYLFTCLAVTSVMSRPEPPAFMELQQENQKAVPLNRHIQQQLPQEHSFANFIVPSNVYGAPDAPERAAVTMLSEDSYNAAYRHSASQKYQTGYNNGPTETYVQKHIYVHVPPKDFEEEYAIKPRVVHQTGPKLKNYKIIFIKSPEAPAILPPVVPPLPESEEKTLIYVLHKKPDTQPDIFLPKPEPTKPSKPEVYFIKYNAKRDEAPVYGPPPPASNEFKLHQLEEPANIDSNNIMPTDHNQFEIETTTDQPKNHEEQQHQVNEEPLNFNDDLNSGPTVKNFVNERAQSTTSEPLNQYLPPETTLPPIVVKDMKQPAEGGIFRHGTSKNSRSASKRRV